MATNNKELRLKVVEALQDDAYKGIARIDTDVMRRLGLSRGDVILIKGGKETIAIVDRAYPADIGENIIRIDGIIRKNAKTGIGELVTIQKAEVKEAKKVTIAPAQQGISVQGNPEAFRQGLLGRAVVKGDIVVLGGAQRRKDVMSEEFEGFFGDIFGDMMNMGFSGFSQLKFIIVNTTPNEPVIITENTQVSISSKAVESSEEKVPDITYEDIGGLNEELRKVREMVELPLKHPEIFERLGIEPPKGVLLHGPPGTGKTLLAKAVANETEANFILLNGPEIMSKFYGESEKKIRDIFEEAEKSAPSIIFIDEIDAIAPKREEAYGEVERRVVSQLLTMMDGLKSRGKVVVIGATNRPNAIDPALRRPGRFDREISINVPDKEGRLAILKIHTRNMPFYTTKMAIDEQEGLGEKQKSALYKIINLFKENGGITKSAFESKIEKHLKEHPEDVSLFKGLEKDSLYTLARKIAEDPKIVNLESYSEITHGFVGADLESLAKEAAMIVLRKHLPKFQGKQKDGEAIPKEVLEQMRIIDADFKEALKVVRPSAMREVLVETPNIKWEDVGGLSDIQQEMKEAVEWPMKHPESFERMGIRPPRGILLYGPPGTGKTLLAKAVAKESEANFIQVKGPSLLSMWVGKSEEGVRKVFERARQVAPCIIFFDEIDALASRRGLSESGGSKVTDQVLNQILAEMDGLEELKGIVVIGATNRPDMLDSALLRPGRFDRILLVHTPDKKGRLEILKIHTKNMPLAKDVDLEEFAERTEGYVGADLESLTREAAMLALRKNLDAKEVSKRHFEDALKKVPPSVRKEDVESYKKVESEYLRSAKAALDKSYLG